MSTAIGEKRLSTKPAERDVRQPARQSKAHPDCRSTTIKSRVTKISLALSSGRDNNPPAATAEMAILIVAVFPSRLSRYSARRIVGDSTLEDRFGPLLDLALRLRHQKQQSSASAGRKSTRC